MANGSTAAERAGRGETEAERGGAFGGFAGEDRDTGTAEVARSRELEEPSSFFSAVTDFFGPKQIGAGLGFLAGSIVGQPVLGAKVGATIGGSSLFASEEDKGPAEPAAAAPQQLTRSAPGVTPTGISAQEQFRSQQAALGGGDGRQVAAALPVSRVSGIQPQVPVVDPRLQQQRFLAGGVLPTVDISAFPGALGRA